MNVAMMQAMLAKLAQHITDEQIDLAMNFVKQAAESALSNAERREWAVARLKERAPLVPERMLRWMVETAILELKAQAVAGIDKLGAELKDGNDK